jgi:hypothetical protein
MPCEFDDVEEIKGQWHLVLSEYRDNLRLSLPASFSSTNWHTPIVARIGTPSRGYGGDSLWIA